MQPRSPLLASLVGVGLVALVGVFDGWTGDAVSVTLVYLVIVGALAWMAGRGPAMVVGALSAVSWYVADYVSTVHPPEEQLVTAANGVTNLVIYVGAALAVSRVRREQQERARLIGELQEALQNVQTLRGLLPMCAWCKRIRDDAGYWHEVEAYVAQHTEAGFTHGICPPCVDRVRQEHDGRER